MIVLKVDTTDVTKWTKDVAKRERAKIRLLEGIGRDFVHEIRDEADFVTATGALRRSVLSSVRGNKVFVSAIGYIQSPMEVGSPPGTRVPPQALKRWASLKLGNKNLAYAVSRKIYRSGTRVWQNKGPRRLTKAIREGATQLMPRRIKAYFDEIK